MQIVIVFAACLAMALATPVRNRRAVVMDPDWSNWSKCSKACDHGRQWRTQGCTETTSGAYSDNCANQTASCNMQPCVDNYGFSDWTVCDAKCGGGKRSRSATKVTLTEEIDCHTHSCQEIDACGAADLYFVWDGSGSIGELNFYKLKQFTIDILKSLPMTPEKETLVGLIQYATDVVVESELGKLPSLAQAEAGIWGYSWITGATNTADALKTLKKKFEAASNRPEHKDIAIIITDGVSNIIKKNTIPNAQALHAMGVEVFAIGVGNIDDAELTGIASLPTDKHKFVVTNFDSLKEITSAIVNGTCEAASRIECDPFTTWGACSVSCGAGKQTRTQTCRMIDGLGNKGTDYDVQETQNCDAGACVVDYCATNPCMNGATCVNGNTTYTCQCAQSFSGVRCEIVDYCASSPCLNGGSCLNGNTTYTCQCVQGFSGVLCEIALVDCSDCKPSSHGIGYLPNILNCGTYFQCERRADGTYTKHTMWCPAGLYWNQDILNCVGAPGFGFNCKYVDPTTRAPTTAQTTVASCAFTAVAGEKTAFIHGRTKLYCAPGTAFDQTACVCVFDMSPLPVSTCDETYYLPFDKDVQDVSCNKAWVGSYFARGWFNVNTFITQKDCIKGGCMYFDGNTRLDIAHFSNRWNSKIQEKFTVSVWLKRTNGGNIGGVINNGDCVDTPSFAIKATDSPSYLAGLDTYDTKDFKLSTGFVSKAADTWHHVALVYDGADMITYVDGKEFESKALTGGLENRFCPINIAHTGRIDYDWSQNKAVGFFEGYMDELRVYERSLSAIEIDLLYSKP